MDVRKYFSYNYEIEENGEKYLNFLLGREILSRVEEKERDLLIALSEGESLAERFPYRDRNVTLGFLNILKRNLIIPLAKSVSIEIGHGPKSVVTSYSGFQRKKLYPYNFVLTDSGHRYLEENRDRSLGDLRVYTGSDKERYAISETLRLIDAVAERSTLEYIGDPEELILLVWKRGYVSFVPDEEILEYSLRRAINEGKIPEELLRIYHSIALGQSPEESSLDFALAKAVQLVREDLKEEIAFVNLDPGETRREAEKETLALIPSTIGFEEGWEYWDGKIGMFELERMTASEKIRALDAAMNFFHGKWGQPFKNPELLRYVQRLSQYRGVIPENVFGV